MFLIKLERQWAQEVYPPTTVLSFKSKPVRRILDNIFYAHAALSHRVKPPYLIVFNDNVHSDGDGIILKTKHMIYVCGEFFGAHISIISSELISESLKRLLR